MPVARASSSKDRVALVLRMPWTFPPTEGGLAAAAAPAPPACRSASAWGQGAEYAAQVARLCVLWFQYGGDCSFMIRAADALYQSIRSRLNEGAPAKPGR